MKGNLLKTLMAKFGRKGAGKAAAGEADDVGAAFATRARKNAENLGGDEPMAGFGHSFKPGQGGEFSPNMGPGAGRGGPMGMPFEPTTQRPFSDFEMLKKKLANMNPAQRAALLAGGAGLGAGGLGGYMMGDEE
jgi:hypothetical protein